MQLTVTIDVPLKQVRDLLTNAFEGGSNYWYGIPANGYKLADGLDIADFKKGGKCQPGGDYYHWTTLIPTTEGCGLYVAGPDESQPSALLDLHTLQRGLQLMATGKYKHHWADWMSENDDATTGDVFLQLSLYGDVIYG